MEFKGEYRFLNNHFYVPGGITFEGNVYPTAEHLYRSLKCDVERDRRAVRQAATPGLAKKLSGRFPMRCYWDSDRVKWMEKVIRAKFVNAGMRKRLLATGTVPIVWDGGGLFWGRDGKKGANNLGILIQNERDRIRAEMVDAATRRTIPDLTPAKEYTITFNDLQNRVTRFIADSSNWITSCPF